MATYTSVKAISVQQKRVRPPLSDILGAIILVVLAIIPLIALVLPMAVIVIVSFDTGGILRFPPQAFSFERYAGILELDGFLDSVRVSVLVALAEVVIDLLLGIPASIGLVRGNFRANQLLSAFYIPQ